MEIEKPTEILMEPIFPVIELFDRLVIAQIKFEKTQANKEELDWYLKQANNHQIANINVELGKLREIHLGIWNLEADLKTFQEHKHSLEEIGRRAIAIRNLNASRINIKNKIAEKLKCEVREIKHNHISDYQK